MSMYVRVKRKKQTIFLTCEQSDTIISLKRKIQNINDVEPQNQRLLILGEKINCDDNKTLRECKIEEGGAIALVYPDTTQESGWEEIDIPQPTPAAAEEPPQ
mmetsp:Transcript_33375/g.66797  ORF Transcript_33375/g.66797 Transcript_33375/m.66797 type:complete len:102 (-) Transcript_33375:147-452(-)